MTRRRFLLQASAALMAPVADRDPRAAPTTTTGARAAGAPPADPGAVTLFLCGDVMTGRGIDQILPHPGRPELHEAYVASAREYVALAERASGPIPRRADFAYIWGDALAELDRMNVDARIVNLETSVTVSDEAWPGKGIHYRMHPANVPCLAAARLDCCVLANNHVLDWGRSGLVETLAALRAAGLRTAGAGRDRAEATSPALIDVPRKGRVLVFAFGMRSSGVPSAWAATAARSGVSMLDDLSPAAVDAVARLVHEHKRPGDIAVLSLHWGGNWGYAITAAERDFARRMVEVAAIDAVHGHSSHHPKGIEVHRDKPILYGCGDLLDDYEGISGYEEFRADLGLMYFPTFEASGKLSRLILSPTRVRRFRVNRATDDEATWLATTLDREGRKLGTRLERLPDGTFAVGWG
jgi:poly-gamma-glutamate synthesis protein (capsule biosynthesis protein)